MWQNYQLSLLICEQKEAKRTFPHKIRRINDKTIPEQDKELLKLETPLFIRQHPTNRPTTLERQAKTHKILNNLLLSLKETKQTVSPENPPPTTA